MYARAVDVENAARQWARTWERAWPAKDAEAIAGLYADGAIYRSHPMRDPEPGSALSYTRSQFELEDAIECRFGAPIATGDRAAVEWWASWIESGRDVTLAGTTVLRFDGEGRVVEHVDYWVEREGRIAPFPGWGTA
jgi:SnoaL-like domain